MDTFHKKFTTPPIEYWPEVRWWLAEGFHTDETLKKDIQMIHDAGFGAAEFLAMDEAGADSSRYGWGSEEWVHDSKLVIEETTKRGMGASMTSGTNWSNANLVTIVPDDKAAAKELNFTAELVPAGTTRAGALRKVEITKPNVNEQLLIAVVAARRVDTVEKTIYLDKDSAIVLTHQTQDIAGGKSLSWTAPEDGDYELIAFWMHGTGQTASPSVSVSYTVNYIDKYGVEALIDYWQEEILNPEVKQLIAQNGRIQMYMDSLELSTYGKGGQFWGYHLLEEFHIRRGYDLTPYLPFVIKSSTGPIFGEFIYYYQECDTAFTDKLRNDLYQTMTDLYMDNMLAPFQAWLHSVGMTLRAEISYGMPFEISQPGKYVDGIETESLEFSSQIESYRNLAGPAHLFGRLYSSETGATMMNYMMGLDFYTQIIYAQFAAGISRTVLHGYSSIAGSEGSTYWPGHEGMWPIFSERFGCRQPAFQHYNDWTDMIARYQMVLRQGAPRIDLGILRLDYNFNNAMFSADERKTYEEGWFRNNEGIYWKDMTLQNAGYTYDYFAPQILEEDDIRFEEGVIAKAGPAYQALIIYQEVMPIRSAARILDWAKQGLPVVLVNNVTEMARPKIDKTHGKAASLTPFNDGLDGELAKIMAEMKALPNVKELDDQSNTYDALTALGVLPRASFAKPNKNILTIMREDGDVRYLYAYNYMYTQAAPFTAQVAIEGVGKPYKLDCWTGKVEALGVYAHGNGCTTVEITLEPGEATLIQLNLEEKEEIHAVSSDAHKVICSENGMFAIATHSGTYTTRLSDGKEVRADIAVPEIIPMDEWALVVEDWNEGEKVTVQEDRGLGYVTDEVYYETKKTKIDVGYTALKPWKDIPAVGPDVSGVGYYTADVQLPPDFTENHGAYLKIGSTNGNSACVYVNGQKAPGVDFNHLEVDVSDLLVPGKNMITVEVSSTLNNRLMQRKYYDAVPDFRLMMQGKSGTIQSTVQDYGMTGKVALIPYTIQKID